MTVASSKTAPNRPSPRPTAPATRSVRERLLRPRPRARRRRPRGARPPRRDEDLPERQDRPPRRRPRHPGGRLRVPRRPVRRRQVDADQAPDPRRGRHARAQVVLDGQDLARLARRAVPKVRRKIGIVFQDFKLLPTKTVWENVAFALEVTGTPRRRIRPAVDRVLALVGLTAQRDQLPGTLSGGEQQRTAIARALVHDPRLIIADEPTGNLDPLISWEIIQLLLRINELGVTVLMATHDADVVTALRKRVVALEEGRIIRDEVGGAYHRAD